MAKFQRRAQRWHPAPAFVVTLLEAFATLLLLRFVWRMLHRLVRWISGRSGDARTQPA